MSEEGFWIYKNGRRIFIRGKRYTNTVNKSNKSKKELYDARLKQILQEKDYYTQKERAAYKQGYKNTEKLLEKRNGDLSMEYLKLFRRKHTHKK